MSNFKAIAEITKVLSEYLTDKLNGNTSSSLPNTVSTKPLDKLEIGTSNEKNQLNLFMYMVTPNSAYRNHKFYSHNAQGQKTSNSYLPLDLHYVLTSCSTGDLIAEELLGFAMLKIEEISIFPQSLITSNLNQDEQLRITMDILSTEEISRLWTSFGAKYRQSAYYKVTAVLIEGDIPEVKAKPVIERNVVVYPFKTPEIKSVKEITYSVAGISKKALFVEVNPVPRQGQITSLILDELNVAEPKNYSFDKDFNLTTIPTSPPGQITFPIESVDPGEYLVRIKIDKAESKTSDDNQSPSVTIS